MNTWRIVTAMVVCAVLAQAAIGDELPKITAMKKRLAATASAYDQTERELAIQQDTRMRLLKELGPDAMSPEGLVETLRGLDNRLFEAKLELRLLEVRREVVVNHIEEHRAAVHAKIKDDEISKLHHAILERLKNQVARLEMQFKNGMVSQADLLAKRNELDRLQIEIAAHERQQMQQLGGDVLTELNRELMRASVDRAVQKALIKQLEQRIAQKRNILQQTMDNHDTLSEHSEQLLRQRKEDLKNKMDAMRIEIREMQVYFGEEESLKKDAE